MSLYKNFAILVAILILVGCASAPQLQKPLLHSASNNIELFRSPLLDQTAHTLQHLNKQKDILYYQTYGGGGAGLGLLGPFGVAANVEMIESNTMKDVAILKDKVNLNPNSLFSTAVLNTGLEVTEGIADSYKISPYVLVEKVEGEKLMFAAVIILDNNSKFPNKYLVQIPIKYTVSELAVLDVTQQKNLEQLVVNGFTSLINRVKAEAAVDMIMEKKITIKSEFLTPRFGFEKQGNLIEIKDDIVWVRMVGSVCGVYSQDLIYKSVTK